MLKLFAVILLAPILGTFVGIGIVFKLLADLYDWVTHPEYWRL